LDWTGPSGQFQVQGTSNLDHLNWQPVGGLTTNRTATIAINGAMTFYRVSQFQPDIRVGQTVKGEQSLPSKQLLRAAEAPGAIQWPAGGPRDFA